MLLINSSFYYARSATDRNPLNKKWALLSQQLPVLFFINKKHNSSHALDRSNSPPNKFKFNKLQMLKLNVIQAALRPADLASQPLPELSDAREAFMATISTLITASLGAQNQLKNEQFLKSLREVIALFTAAFVKNMNLGEMVQVFECELEGRRVAVHLLLAYVQILQLQLPPTHHDLYQETLQSLLILLSANLHTCTEQSRYFYDVLLGNFTGDERLVFFESLLEQICSIATAAGSKKSPASNSQYTLWPLITATPIPSRIKVAGMLLLCVFCESPGFFDILAEFSDSKTFGLLVLAFTQLLSRYPESLNLAELSVFSFVLNCLVLQSAAFRRFILSKLDIEDFVKMIIALMYLYSR